MHPCRQPPAFEALSDCVAQVRLYAKRFRDDIEAAAHEAQLHGHLRHLKILLSTIPEVKHDDGRAVFESCVDVMRSCINLLGTSSTSLNAVETGAS